jgi:CubicO group peptidase (beta-lactamase class C family)
VNLSVLDGLRLTVREKNLGLYGIRVWQEGEGEVTHFWRSNDPVCLYSAAKTFTSLAVGICVDRGLFTVDDTLFGFFPEDRALASEGTESITVKHLLHMASGKREYWFAGPLDRRKNADWAGLWFADPVKETPGKTFFYSNANTYMLGRLVEKVTGKTLRDFLVPNLFDPLGIDNPQWHTCPQGHTLAATQLHLTLDEFSRLGRLLVAGGVWEGQPLVSQGYLAQAAADLIPTRGDLDEYKNGYGYQLWNSCVPGAYRADGKYGQLSLVYPHLKASVTITAHEEFRAPEILQAVREDLLPRLG